MIFSAYAYDITLLWYLQLKLINIYQSKINERYFNELKEFSFMSS